VFAPDVRVAKNIDNYFDHDKFNAMYGHTNADIDGDGIPEFFVLNDIVFSKFWMQKIGEKIISVEGARLSFMKLERRTVVVTYSNQTNSLLFFSYTGGKLILEQNFSLDSQLVNNESRFIINPVASIDGEPEKYLMIVLNKSLLILRVTDTKDYRVELVKHIMFNNAESMLSKNNLRIGGIGDYNGDKTNDIWLVYRNYRDIGVAWLLDGKKLFSGSNMTREEATLIELNGAKEYSEQRDSGSDGIGSSISYHSGDINDDGIVDFSIGSHFGLSYSGAMYILSGKNIRDLISSGKKNISISDEGVLRIRSILGSELAPPFYHEDLYDVDNDGYAGYNAGAVYVLSGKKMTEQNVLDKNEQ